MLRIGCAPILLVQYRWVYFVFKSCAVQIPAYGPLTEALMFFKGSHLKSDDTFFKQTSLPIFLDPYSRPNFLLNLCT
jgi:hypothetical protein